jgi:hypothetical protein
MKVAIGPTTWVGWVTMAVGLLPSLVKTVESGVVSFHGPEKYLALAGIIAGSITNAGRYLQAHAQIKAGK